MNKPAVDVAADDVLAKQRKTAVPHKSVRQKRDDDIMDTNNSSIVSKRSVEKLYYKDQPGYFRYFVRRFQRRSPLINRGYWLRMKAIEQVVEQFLDRPSNARKLVVNLGCGYDPLPFQFIQKNASTYAADGNVFVDVDYPQLMLKKKNVILETPQLSGLLGHIQVADAPALLQSATYYAIGCDLRDLQTLERALQESLKWRECEVLFVAEVSITYMDTRDADALIMWAATHSKAQFCLLEQFLPDGPGHPFAATMLKHFEKLKTQLKSIKTYPSLKDQHDRFSKAGWVSAHVEDLWSICQQLDTKSLDAIEPFDEWEELALFAGHYFLLTASNIGTPPGRSPSQTRFAGPQLNMVCKAAETPARKGCRRFGAIFRASEDTVALHGGLGLQSRLRDSDIYSILNHPEAVTNPPLSAGVMCHTITMLKGARQLMVGGRTSPDNPVSDCWILSNGTWQKTHSLPRPRYRHCAVAVERDGSIDSEGVLVFGGRGPNGEVLGDALVWNPEKGWQNVNIEIGQAGRGPGRRFGAAMCLRDGLPSCNHGILLGGIDETGKISQSVWNWSLVYTQDEWLMSGADIARTLSDTDVEHMTRFGAVTVPRATGTLLVGGVSRRGPLEYGEEIMFISKESKLIHVEVDFGNDRPLLIGCGATVTAEDYVLILGGGAVCFSFGSFWNRHTYMFSERKDTMDNGWKLHVPTMAADKVSNSDSLSDPQHQTDQSHTSTALPSLTSVPRARVCSRLEFDNILTSAKPVILEQLDLGPCVERWDLSYLERAVGAERAVVVHSSESPHMNFQRKNFQYVTVPFGDFLSSIKQGEQMYLRALASSKPAEQVTTLADDFSRIADDFHLPDELAFATENMHSSPLRISGPVRMWLHYDVMANVLCQIRGSKRLLLFPPRDVTKLRFAAGASSSEVDIFDLKETDGVDLGLTTPYEALLRPGDVLFIPAMWLHTAAPTEGISVAVNVFFRNLQSVYAAGKDVYGNRDLQVYEKGRNDLAKLLKAFEGLPKDVGEFYLSRLAQELAEKARLFGV